MSIEIKITKEYNGVKPKNFIKKKVDVPFFKVVDLIKEKRITINGKKIKKEDVLKTGDILKVWPNDITLREGKSYQTKSQNLNIESIYEDEDLLVLNKLPGVIVQGAQHNDKSLSLHLAWHKKQIKDECDFEYFHVHRLDKDTSGVLVVGKNAPTVRDLNQIFRERDIVKKYICLCVGEPKYDSGEINKFMNRNPQGSREKMRVCNERDVDAKRSISDYKVLKKIEFENETLSLIEVTIKTGITHQIRVHMKAIGCPILADTMYGNSFVNRKFEDKINRQFLHASHLEFTYKDKKHIFDAPFTKDLEKFMNIIGMNV